MDLNPTTILVLLVGGVTVFIAFHNPVLGAAIVVGVAVVTLLAFLIKDNEERKRDGKKEEHKGIMLAARPVRPGSEPLCVVLTHFASPAGIERSVVHPPPAGVSTLAGPEEFSPGIWPDRVRRWPLLLSPAPRHGIAPATRRPTR